MTARLAPLLLSALALASASRAQDEPVARVDSETSFVGFGYFDSITPDSYPGRAELSFTPRLELLLPGDLRVETAVQLRGDAFDASRNRLYLMRGLVDASFAHWDLRAGRQVIRTGKVDGIRPTDYFRRLNLTDFLDPDEEPIDAARADYYASGWIFTGVLAPYFQPDIVPLDPRNPWTGPLLPPAPPGGPSVDFVQSSALRPSGLSSGEVGLWAGRRTGGLDWSASYFYGHDRVASSYVIEGPTVPPPIPTEVTVELLPRYRRLHAVGIDGETTVGSFALRGEASYTRYADAPPDPASFESPFAMLALGVDRTFSSIVRSHDLYVNAQYQFDSGSTDGAAPEGALEYASPFRHFYRHAVTSLVEYRFDAFRKLVAKMFWNPADGDYVVQSELDWKPWDGWTWSVGVDVVGGPAGSFFGTYAANDRARTALTYDWQMWERRPEAPPSPLPGLRLEATARLRDEWIALIDGKMVRRGDVVEGAEVLRIDDGIVELEMDGRRFSLVLSR